MNRLPVLIKFCLAILLSSGLPYVHAEVSSEDAPKLKDDILIATALPKSHEFFSLAEEVLGVIANRMGENIKLISIPGKRSASLLKNHEIHAELARIAEYKQKVPSAIKVPESIIELSRHAYSINYNFPVKGWESLKPYHAVTVRGSWIISVYMVEHQVSIVDSMRSAFQFLKSGRADIFVTSSALADSFLAATDLDVSGIVRLEPAVYTSKEYTFFAKEYSELALRFEVALRSIKEDGTYRAILEKWGM